MERLWKPWPSQAESALPNTSFAVRCDLVALRRLGDGASEMKRLFVREPRGGAASAARSLGRSSRALALFDAVFVLYLHRRGLSAFSIGAVLMAGNVGFLAAAFYNTRNQQASDSGSGAVIGSAVSAIGALLLVAARGSHVTTLALAMVGRTLIGAGETIYTINQLTARQAVTPPHLLGRMNASVRLVAGAGLALGGFLASGLATFAGLRMTLLAAAALMVATAGGLVTAYPTRRVAQRGAAEATRLSSTRNCICRASTFRRSSSPTCRCLLRACSRSVPDKASWHTT